MLEEKFSGFNYDPQKTTSLADQFKDYVNDLQNQNGKTSKGINWNSVANGLQNFETAAILFGAGGLFAVVPEISSKAFTAGCWLGSAFYGTIGVFDVLVGLTGNKGPSEYLPGLNPISDAIKNVLN